MTGGRGPSSRRRFLREVTALPLAIGAAARGARPARGADEGGAPERSRLTVGLSSHAVDYLGLYVAVEHTFADEGLAGNVAVFNGPAQVSAALVSGAVDLAPVSLSSAITMVGASHPVRVFYTVTHRPNFAWYARRPLRAWADLRGRTVAVSGFGSLPDVLTRYVLGRHGLAPGRDVQLAQAGTAVTRLAALRAGRVDAAMLLPPYTWQAEDLGFVLLGSQASEVAPTWPQIVLVAPDAFRRGAPRTVRAFLRAYVRALRLLRQDRDVALRVLRDRLKIEPAVAERAYAEILPAFDERGALPAAAMPLFWELAIAAGEVSEAWPESRFLDRTYLDAFDTWAPR